MTTLSISPQGQITLPLEILQINTWKGHSEVEMLRIGDTVVLRPTHYPKSDDISDLGGFFKNNTIVLSTEQLCKPVHLTQE
ncbi:AbrB/MazE/SpoVT family DNA-binding domain-containing protein [Crenothrix sp.]|uniref:AbrB/MazE/SpoVT family DNA-binding domain-containing protein n=1 Tax=Crenothrix sp. TaxID=3100433 RepID=UPI00374D4633